MSKPEPSSEKSPNSQQQFLNVIDRDEAEKRFHAALTLAPLGIESIPLREALGRVLATDITAEVDVPSFDRSNFDGFAVRAKDTYGAQEEDPKTLTLLPEVISTGIVPESQIDSQTAANIATGAMLPRGADAVLMVEFSEVQDGKLIVQKSVAPGTGVAFAGTDISSGETVLRAGELLTSRETGVLAAIGLTEVEVFRKPKVAIISTGDEVIEPGEAMRPGLIYDSNQQIIADAVTELGGEPICLGVVHDQRKALREKINASLDNCDVLILSGGTSKGAGDLSYHMVDEVCEPGIVAHGVALKPGKPICLAVHHGNPVVILPGFPTSAIFTFHEFVAPVIRRLGGYHRKDAESVNASLAVKVNSQIGRTEYLLVNLIEDLNSDHYVAYPMGRGSGSVTTFSRADGFITIGRHEEIVPAGTQMSVQKLSQEIRPADLVVIGSHCIGLDLLLSELQSAGEQTSKFIAVGSTAGLMAAKKEQCDLAGIHLLDPETGEYNLSFIDDTVEHIPGYRRSQGILYRKDDSRFAGKSADEIRALVTGENELIMVNRNQGSGTRILIDQFLKNEQPTGYAIQTSNHNAVAASITQKKSDWGIAIETVANRYDLGFVPLQDEHFDFVIPKSRLTRPAVQAFLDLLQQESTRTQLKELGFTFG